MKIVQELRVDRSVLFDYLRSKAVFDAEDCQIVNAEITNERKASKLLDILETKGTKGLQHFLEILKHLNPGLYEKITRQRPTPDLTSECAVDILGIHLKGNQQPNTLLEELKTVLDVKSSKKCLQYLQVKAVRGGEKAPEACYDPRQNEEKGCKKYAKERHACVLVLLIKLLSAEEEAKKLKIQVEEERKKNAELLNKLKKLSQSFDEEQWQSMKLSETTALQQSSLKTIKDLTSRNREQNMERNQAISELRQLKSWVEAFKAHYESVEKSAQQCQERNESNTAEISALRERLIRTEEELKSLKMGETSINSPSLVNKSSEHEWKEWLSFLPYEVLAGIACSSDQNSVDGPISNLLNLGVPVSSSAECNPQWKHSPEEVICENQSLYGCYVIDDSITPQPRPRAYDIDRSRTSCYKFRALRRIP